MSTYHFRLVCLVGLSAWAVPGVVVAQGTGQPPAQVVSGPGPSGPATAQVETGSAESQSSVHKHEADGAIVGTSTAKGPVLILAEEDLGGGDSPEITAPAEKGRSLSYGQRVSVLDGGALINRIADDERGVTFGGYGQHLLQAREADNISFKNHRYILFVYGRLNERISTSTEIEFEFGGSPLKRDGILGAGEVLLEFSVLDVEVAEWLTLRAGIILMPVSSFNINHDAPTRDLVDRPIGYTTVIPSTWFESGAGILGTFKLPADMALSYELYLVNGLDARISDGFGLRGARGSHWADNNSDKAFTGRIAFRPTLSAEFGVSGYSGVYDKRDNRVNIINGDFRLRLDAFEFLGEIGYVAIDPGFVEGFSASSVANTRAAVPEGMFTYFVQANYHFRIEPLFRLFPEELQQATFTGVVRYEAMDTDTNYRSALGDKTRLTLGLNFRPIEQVAVKFDFQWNAQGQDGVRKAPHFFQGDFYEGRAGGFLFDSFVASIAYLY